MPVIDGNTRGEKEPKKQPTVSEQGTEDGRILKKRGPRALPKPLQKIPVGTQIKSWERPDAKPSSTIRHPLFFRP